MAQQIHQGNPGVAEKTETDAKRELRTCLQKALTGMQFGQIVLLVHDGQVSRIEMNEKVRLYNSR